MSNFCSVKPIQLSHGQISNQSYCLHRQTLLRRSMSSFSSSPKYHRCFKGYQVPHYTKRWGSEILYLEKAIWLVVNR